MNVLIIGEFEGSVPPESNYGLVLKYRSDMLLMNQVSEIFETVGVCVPTIFNMFVYGTLGFDSIKEINKACTYCEKVYWILDGPDLVIDAKRKITNLNLIICEHIPNGEETNHSS
jgi:hypothetical protein